MMTDFVNRYHDKFASTDDFRKVAGEHFAKSPIGRKYNLDNLDWFFKEWVYHTELPSYQMDYHVENLPDGKFMLTGTVTQQNVPDDWFMPLPVVLSFGGNQQASRHRARAGTESEFSNQAAGQADQGRTGSLSLGAFGKNVYQRAIEPAHDTDRLRCARSEAPGNALEFRDTILHAIPGAL
jgi:aminopeptidase N